MASAFWYSILVVSALAFAVVRLCLRPLVRRHGALPSLFLFDVLGTVALLPFAVYYGTFPVTAGGWIALGGLLILLVIGEYLAVKSFETVNLSEREPILATTIFFIMVFGALFLNEIVTALDIVGALLIFAGVIALSWGKGVRSLLHTSGHVQLWVVAIGMTFILLLTAVVLKETAVVTLAALSYGCCAVVYGVLLRSRMREVSAVGQSYGYLLLAISCSLVAYLFSMWAIQNIGAVSAALFARLTPIFVAVGAYALYHDERKDFSRTGAAIALTVAGCVCVVV